MSLRRRRLCLLSPFLTLLPSREAKQNATKEVVATRLADTHCFQAAALRCRSTFAATAATAGASIAATAAAFAPAAAGAAVGAVVLHQAGSCILTFALPQTALSSAAAALLLVASEVVGLKATATALLLLLSLYCLLYLCALGFAALCDLSTA